MNKIILSLLLFLMFKTSKGDEIKTSVILENCNVCHTKESSKSNSIRPLKALKKNIFYQRCICIKWKKVIPL